MSFLAIARRSMCVLVVFVTTGGILCAQLPEIHRGRATRLQHQPRMKVIEVKPQGDTEHYFTVIGAVQRSGVFIARQSRIPLQQLMKAAGGMHGLDQSSIRIVRNGQAGLQLYYLAEQQFTQEIQANDIVVVVPAADQWAVQSEGDEYVPVACLGLANRPIVLPLSLGISSVDRLLNELGQSPEVLDAVRVLDPLGALQTDRLIPGSILFFDPVKLNRQSLSTVAAFPPAVPLENTEHEVSVSESDDITIENESITEASRSDFNSVLGGSPQSKPGSEKELRTPLLIPHQAEGSLVDIVPPTALREELGMPSAVGADPEDMRSSPPGVDHLVIDSVAPDFLELLPEEEHSEATVGPIVNTTNSSNIAQPLQTSTAPPPPEEIRVLRDPGPEKFGIPQTESTSTDRLANSSESLTSEKSVPMSASVTEQSASKDLKSVGNQILEIESLWIFGLLAITGSICLVSSIIWSRKERRQLRQARQRSREVNNVSELRATPDGLAKSSLQSVLDPQTPFIEEDVLLPEFLELHGEPVGQRRILFHEDPQPQRGPYFSRLRKQIAEASAAREEKRNVEITDAFSPMEIVLEPVLSQRAAPEYDIVTTPSVDNPDDLKTGENSVDEMMLESKELHSQGTMDVVVSPVHEDMTADESALERALKILAQTRK